MPDPTTANAVAGPVERLIRHVDNRLLKGYLHLRRHARSHDAYRRIVDMTRRPVILGGCGRSGTTLLLAILSAHPRIFCLPNETNALAPTGGDPHPDYSAPFRMNKIYDELLGAHIPEPCVRWCEKTPRNVRYARRILKYFGKGARYINVVRDGRDVVTSVLRVKDPNSYWIAPERWVADVDAGVRIESHPQAMSVRYEDILDNFEGTLRTLCRFIGEDFDPALLDFSSSARVQWSRSGGAVAPLHRDSVKRWESPEYGDVVNRLLSIPRAKELLAHYGYE